ncbi:methionyl-tRNA formyltransferase [Colwellia chukchiensis]|uniref:Methionyl-tRNA formyltransferase n=1 Tax=Colwellia chukchiensis TaxID=641665 RepID=A0A1H7QLJ5_9GAMM|nr:formyltransferase family protein [Colwellia chukchiensis]SEL48689.1 methionyl-tRNA formyltransferase [Colwellia chukchiensis]
MKIILLLNNDIASNFALNLLLPSLAAHQVQVFLSSKVGGNSARPQALQELALFEQTGIYQALAQSKTASAFKTYADIRQQYPIAIDTLNDINSRAGIAKIKAAAADLIISIRYGVILKPPVIALAKHGVINLHSGQLPAYRGVMATFWALLNGEKKLATSLHFIDDNSIDTGDIIGYSSLAVQQGHCYLWHVLSLYIGGCQLLSKAITGIASGKALSTTKQASQGQYYSFPDAEQVNRFIRQCGALYEPQALIKLLTEHHDNEQISR